MIAASRPPHRYENHTQGVDDLDNRFDLSCLFALRIDFMRSARAKTRNESCKISGVLQAALSRATLTAV
jgi:hypothetical protein